MQITVHVPDSVGNILKTSPDSQQMMTQALVEVADKLREATLPRASQKSKWARMVEEIENSPELNLNGYSEQLMAHTREFRENFTFNHDK